MAITSVTQLGHAYESDYSDFTISKASVANTVAGQYTSLWRSIGLPAQGAIPGGAGTGPIICNNTTVGAIPITQQTSPRKSYLSKLSLTTANNQVTLEIHDRLAHLGGLVGNVTTSQITSFDFASLSLSNIDERKGDANYSDIQWWLEWYTDTGATGTTVTCVAVFNDGSTANLTGFVAPAQTRSGRCFPLNGLVAAADQGKFIRGINSISLTPSTTGAGNFGITATRYRGSLLSRVLNKRTDATWHNLGFPEIYANSCLTALALVTGTTSGIINASGRVVHG